MGERAYRSVRESRRYKRRPHNETVDFSIVMPELREQTKSSLRGTIYEISDGGAGIQADYPLKPGIIVAFTLGNSLKRGVIRWANKVDDHYHKAGLAFRTDATNGLHYPVDLSDTGSEIKEDLGEYVAALEKKTEKYVTALEELTLESSLPGADGKKIMYDLRLLNDDICKACAQFEKAAAGSVDLIQAQRKLFHAKTDHIISKSVLFRHARTWPRGYQGDFKMLENVYKNMPLSQGIGYYIDQYALSLPLAKAVRGRIMMLQEIIRQEIIVRHAASVLNIACGSCRELMGLAPDIVNAGAKITCIDTDVDALAFAMERLSHTAAAENVMFRKYNAVKMFDDELNMAEFGKMDVIYSVGLFDYLPSDFLEKLLGALYRLLLDKGTLVAAFKDGERYRHQDLHWLIDWTGFQQRNEREFQSILEGAGIPAFEIREERDDTGIIIFYVITKQ